ncbi:hypothetical protein CONLIGDRAFT_376503 [Coniochaeta ligniaria NRRL 30616]|uniref:Uncharacterized protein n=1 Tax=Coniochaeta ligniaria NRRL 30616 TaxID=1408157 RepID=A0A1J7ILH2_9PEZI|nr:hypothetical protein CONLIGDRAFT_376503 [Coniochaeta ligniaria NRRL 30616]
MSARVDAGGKDLDNSSSARDSIFEDPGCPVAKVRSQWYTRVSKTASLYCVDGRSDFLSTMTPFLAALRFKGRSPEAQEDLPFARASRCCFSARWKITSIRSALLLEQMVRLANGRATSRHRHIFSLDDQSNIRLNLANLPEIHVPDAKL